MLRVQNLFLTPVSVCLCFKAVDNTMISLHSCQAHVIMSVWKILCPLERLKAWVVSVVEISAIEGVCSRRSNNGTVAVTLGPPTPGAVSIGPGKGRIKYNFASEIL